MGSKIKSNLVRDAEKLDLSPVESIEVCKLVRDGLLDGLSRTDIKEDIRNQHNIEDEKLLNYAYQKGLQYYQERSLSTFDVKQIISLHISHYEQIYQKFKAMDSNAGMRLALNQKESLLGFHRERNVVEFNQHNVTIIEDGSGYNMSKLNPEEKKRFTELMGKVEENG